MPLRGRENLAPGKMQGKSHHFFAFCYIESMKRKAKKLCIESTGKNAGKISPFVGLSLHTFWKGIM